MGKQDFEDDRKLVEGQVEQLEGPTPLQVLQLGWQSSQMPEFENLWVPQLLRQVLVVDSNYFKDDPEL